MSPVAPTEVSSDGGRYHHGDLRRALITAALSLLTEKQDWGFSLREVARRAGVSHNAPYNHFNSKQELLLEVAATGYDLLRARMQAALLQAGTAPAMLKAIGIAYVHFGVQNPAHYRLMFGTALHPERAGAKEDPNAYSPALSAFVEAATAAKRVLRDVIQQGANEGSFAIAPTDTPALEVAVLSAWSLVHGLTLLLLDGLAGAETQSGSAGGTESPPPIADHVIEKLLDGM